MADTNTRGRVLTIILNYKTPEMTLACARDALREMEEIDGEIVIIDNGSADGSYEKLQQAAADQGWFADGRLRVVASPCNGGFGAGMNIGFAIGLSDGSQPDFYYLLNSDAFVQPGAIRALQRYLLAAPRVGLVGSFVRGTDGESHCTAFRFPSIAGEFEGAIQTGLFTRLLRNSVVPMDLPNEPTQLDWTAGASLMIRRSVITEIGGFDERFFLYFEETDLCRRAMKAGWQTHYLPTSEVAHVGSASTGMKTWQRTPAYWFDSRLHYFTKSHGRLYALLATMALVSGSLLYRLRRLVSDKPATDPPYFLRDLISHHLRCLFKTPISQETTQPVRTQTVPSSAEEPK
ncbi:glycosyltransferase family 2 protein [Phaeobacter sp.]|uniref:glycosyltransferase family 2 protein n=1 Tax=Phaeobacter sp. TaxID=1902409 RepID=UPI0025D69FC7|nr:glycosyltransferase family 2 protein [Phaeobacter sp.]